MILDSCIVIEIQKGNRKIINEVYAFEQDKIFVTPIVVEEFYRGAKKRSR